MQPQRPRGPDRRRGRAEVQPDRPARHPEPLRASEWAQAADVDPVGQARQAAGLARPLLQAARQSSASSRTPTPPPKLDFNLWLGPAPEQPFNANLVHYNWHWFWDFGNGDIGNQGVHQMDIARWLIPGADRCPTERASASAAGSATPTRAQTANTQITRHGLRRHPADLRGPRPEDRRLPRREGRQHRPSRGGDDRRRQVLPQGEATRPSRCRSSVRASRPSAGRATATSATSSPPSAAARPTTSTPTSSKATTPPPSATWPTSRTGSASRSRSTRRPRPSATTRTPTRPSPGWKSTSQGQRREARRPELPPRPQADLRRDDRVVRRRPRGQQAPDPPLPRSRSSCPIGWRDAWQTEENSGCDGRSQQRPIGTGGIHDIRSRQAKYASIHW